MTMTEQDLRLTQVPVATAAMLIRKPAAEVFAAFADPEITTRFWFTKSSGKLEPGARVRWEWEMYGVSSGVVVQEIVPDRRIVVAWGDDNPTTIEWQFTPHTADTTFVSVTNSGFRGDGDALVAQAIGSTEGFALVLAGCKAFLEHGLELNLTGDRHPTGFTAE
jgi:uncharacterized protein YndB with AHSA1/START domain